ncbi:MAG: ParB N-terminal domain-containing protein [Pseudomonadota bacterium]
MAEIKGINVGVLDLDEIDVGRRVRAVSVSAVNIIAASIEDLGSVTSPIHVRKTKKGYCLIDDAHRLAAAQQLGMSTIPAKVWQCTADQAALMESDANISTAHMPPLELAVSLAARKRTYQKLHPETRQGHAGAKGRWTDEMQRNSSSFASWMADVFQITPRQVRKIIAAGEGLTSDQIRWLREAPKPVTLADLQALSKVDDENRSAVCIKLTNGDAKSVADAVKRLRAPSETPVKDPVETAFKALREAWSRAPKAARKRFLSHEAADIYDFLIAEGMIK